MEKYHILELDLEQSVCCAFLLKLKFPVCVMLNKQNKTLKKNINCFLPIDVQCSKNANKSAIWKIISINFKKRNRK